MDGTTGNERAERFARAVDAPPGAAPDRDPGPRDPGPRDPEPRDPELAGDLAVVAALRQLGPALDPDDGARERMRARVLAGPAPVVSSRRSRFAIALVAALALVFALGGMSLLLSRDALPGEALYGVKRTAEAASLGLTFGDEPKALKHLEFAAARVDEVETLAQRYPDPVDAPVGGYLTALTDFDNDSAQGSRQLIALATRGDVQRLSALRTWATQQGDRLAALEPRLPVAARNRAAGSRVLLAKIAERTTALLARVECDQITSGATDDVGAVPATSTCHQPTVGDTGSGSPPPAGATPVSPGAKASAPHTPPPAAPGPVSPAAPVVPTTPATTTARPAVPLVPVPVPAPSVPAPVPSGVPSVPRLPVPVLEPPPLLPGLPAIRIG